MSNRIFLPLVIALALGLAASLLPFELPSVLTRTVGLFAGAAAPVSPVRMRTACSSGRTKIGVLPSKTLTRT